MNRKEFGKQNSPITSGGFKGMAIRLVSTSLGCVLSLLVASNLSWGAADNAIDFLDELKGLYLDNSNASHPSRKSLPLGVPKSSNRMTKSPQSTKHEIVDQSMLATTYAIPYRKSRLVVITRNVQFATVLVDGIIMGMTPIAIDLPDNHVSVLVEIRKKGYQTKTESITLTSGHTKKWVARLNHL